MIISKQIMDDFLEPYLNSSRYLKSAKDSEASFIGNFSIVHSTYLNAGISSGHLNMVDLLICFNQLTYVGIANKLQLNKLTELQGITYDLFKKEKLNGLIYALDEIKFRKPIDSTNFNGEISIEQIKKRLDVYFIKTEFNFENSVTGKIGIAMKIKN